MQQYQSPWIFIFIPLVIIVQISLSQYFNNSLIKNTAPSLFSDIVRDIFHPFYSLVSIQLIMEKTGTPKGTSWYCYGLSTFTYPDDFSGHGTVYITQVCYIRIAYNVRYVHYNNNSINPSKYKTSLTIINII